MKLYSIRDRVAMEFSPPTPLKNDAVAVRWFFACMEKVPEGAVASDYELFQVGKWDSETGTITGRFLEDGDRFYQNADLPKQIPLEINSSEHVEDK